MPMTMQAKLLRVLEEGEIERVGGDKPFTVDVRVVVATHRNLEEQVRQGTFREDLYHRVFVFPVVLPPLRERREDIRVLAEYFIKQLDEQNHWKEKTLASEALAELEKYSWPGNVRELRNVIERVLLFETSATIQASTVARALPQSAAAANGSAASTSAANLTGALANGMLSQRVEAFERETILAVLKQNHHHMTNTAKALGLERSHLYKKCQQLGIDLRAIRHSE
jgi:two-component system, NtrC family, nitrogen regulation response regulator NtrX